MIPIRDENPTRVRPVITVLLIAANAGIFLYQMTLPPEAARQLILTRGLIPGDLTRLPDLGTPALGPGAASIVTSMFLHGGLLHLLFNVWFLWIFGNNVEEAMGRIRYPVFYLLCGVAAALTQVAVFPASTVPMIGASGAIAGVLGAYFLLYPHARILTLVPFFFLYIVRLPAFVVLGLWFALQVLYSAMSDPARGGVAWSAHAGGFVAGMLLVPIFRKGSRGRGPRPARDSIV